MKQSLETEETPKSKTPESESKSEEQPISGIQNSKEELSSSKLPNVKSLETLYENLDTQASGKFDKPKKLQKKEFVFKYNSDKNGLLHFLGSEGGRRDFVNPLVLGEVKVFFSSLSLGEHSGFVGRQLTKCQTQNQQNSFMGLDLGEKR